MRWDAARGPSRQSKRPVLYIQSLPLPPSFFTSFHSNFLFWEGTPAYHSNSSWANAFKTVHFPSAMDQSKICCLLTAKHKLRNGYRLFKPHTFWEVGQGGKPSPSITGQIQEAECLSHSLGAHPSRALPVVSLRLMNKPQPPAPRRCPWRPNGQTGTPLATWERHAT